MLSKDAKTAIALGAGALYVYIGVQKEESANWTFDALLVVGLLLIGTVLYGLFKKSGGSRRRGTRAPFARPYASPVAPGNVAPASTPAPSPAVAPTQTPPPPQRKSEAAPFSSFANDSLAEWTTTAPGQNSWNPTLVPIQQKPGAPLDVKGFSFQ